MKHHRPTAPFPGPVPIGMMRVSADIPMEMWEELLCASQRRGVDVGDLLVAALTFAATA